MKLSELLKKLDGILDFAADGPADAEISGVAYDSRAVSGGGLFCCVDGFKTDGHSYIAQALEKGAAAVCVSRDVPVAGAVRIRVADGRKALALLSSSFYDFPAEKMDLIGVTGTNGKTTATFMIEFLLNRLGRPAGLSGTMYSKIGELKIPAKTTTPESCDLQALLARMAASGMEAAVFEVSSHALNLHRVTGCRFKVMVFTNLTQDHLDFHAGFEEYYQAKRRLFTRYAGEGAVAVINGDDSWGKRLLSDIAVPAVTYGLEEGNLLRALEPRVTPQSISYLLEKDGVRIPVTVPVSGFFNIYNSLAAIAAVESLGFDLAEAASLIGRFGGVKGRFETIRSRRGFSAVVDYAHTPDGLENVLSTARKITPGRLITVFGCGGDRDSTKRPLMGEIAGRYSDMVFITSDNPRTEDPEEIISHIEKGLEGCGGRYCRQADRLQAIHAALASAGQGDTVVIAGKGHEDYQIFKDRTVHFDDGEAVRDFFREKGM